MTTPTSSTMEPWRDRVALVTGASAGIGAATARALAGAGMRVAVGARRVERLATLEAEFGDRILARRLDLRDEGSIAAFFAEVRASWGGVEVLVNNAGLARKGTLLDGATEGWREMLEVNVLGLCVATREALADMRARGDRGYVIHISSMAGHRVPSGGGVYAATKYAVRALTEGLRKELREAGSGIRVSAISPGFVETEFAAVFHESEERARETYGRFPCLQADDIANAVIYLLSQPDYVEVHDILMRPTRQAN